MGAEYGGFFPELQSQAPDVIGQYLRGVMAPGQIQGQQQQLQEGALNIQQLRMMLQGRENIAAGFQALSQPTLGGTSGGTQDGPQAGVAAQAASNAPAQSLAYPYQPGGSGPNLAPAPSAATMGAVSSLSPGMAQYLQGIAQTGGDPLKAQQELIANQRQQAQFGWANDTGFSGEPFLRQMTLDKNAPNILQRNWDQLGGFYTQAAFAAGVDARDLNSPDPVVRAHAVNKVGEFIYNRRAIPIGAAPIKAPTMYTQEGIGEGGTQQRDLDTNETKPGISRQEPTKVGERWNPQTGQNEAVYQQFAPTPPGVGGAGGGAAPARGGAAAGGAPAGSGGGGMVVPMGYKAPTDPELKSAMFASEMYSGLQTVQKLEAKGIKLPPNVRTAMLDAAASDNDGVIHQFLSQEALLRKLTPDQQTYMQALMPILQAFGHSQAGARVSMSQMRTNFEGIVPIDPANKSDLQQAMENRHGFYVGALSQAGSALQLPQYAGLKGELTKAQSQAQAAASIPAAAVAQLKEGHHTTFSNGQVWTLQNGKPVQVK